MRFNNRITFVTESEGGFNPETGSHDEPRLVKTTKPCNISTVGINRSKELFGEIDTNVTIARLQQPHLEVFDYVHLNNVNDKKYKVKRQSDYRKGAFYLEGAN